MILFEIFLWFFSKYFYDFIFYLKYLNDFVENMFWFYLNYTW